jgi:hypothetical protein
MSNKTKKRTRAIGSVLMLLIISSTSACEPPEYTGPEDALPYTRELHTVDKIELLKLKKTGDVWDGSIEASKIIGAQESLHVAALWRAQMFDRDVAHCHIPDYGMKFYYKDELIAYTAICWECNNISFITPESIHRVSFEGNEVEGKHLLKVFTDAFPE